MLRKYTSKIKQGFYNLLQKSEKYTKTDMIYLFEGGFWLSIKQISSSLGALVITIAFANILAIETFGEYRFLMSSFLVLIIFSLPGMHTALLESTPKGFNGNLRLAFKKMMKLGFLGAIVGLVISIYYYLQGNIAIALGFMVVAFAIPFFESSSSYISYLQALKKFKKVAIYTAVTQAILISLSIVVAIIYPNQTWYVIMAFLFGQILPNLFFLQKTKKEFAGDEEAIDPRILKYAKHLTIMALIGFVALQLDKILVWKFMGAEELAIFYIAYIIPQEAERFLRIIPTLAFPKFAKTDPEKIKKTLIPKIIKYGLFIIVAIVIYILISPFIFELIFPKYIDSIGYSRILMISLIAMAFAPIQTYLTTLKATKSLYFLNTFFPGARIVISIPLIIFWGLWGAVIAVVISSFVRIGILLFLFNHSKTECYS